MPRQPRRPRCSWPVTHCTAGPPTEAKPEAQNKTVRGPTHPPHPFGAAAQPTTATSVGATTGPAAAAAVWSSAATAPRPWLRQMAAEVLSPAAPWRCGGCHGRGHPLPAAPLPSPWQRRLPWRASTGSAATKRAATGGGGGEDMPKRRNERWAWQEGGGGGEGKPRDVKKCQASVQRGSGSRVNRGGGREAGKARVRCRRGGPHRGGGTPLRHDGGALPPPVVPAVGGTYKTFDRQSARRS